MPSAAYLPAAMMLPEKDFKPALLVLGSELIENSPPERYTLKRPSTRHRSFNGVCSLVVLSNYYLVCQTTIGRVMVQEFVAGFHL